MLKRLLPFWPELLAVLVIGPIGYMAMDRTAPQVRERGFIIAHDVPGCATEQDAEDQRCWPRIGGFFDVHWISTPHVRDCPGVVQVEVMQGNVIWPVMKRGVFNPPVGSIAVDPDPWPVPDYIRPGKAVYRVSTFWQCNLLQRVLPNFSIYQVGPDLEFHVLPRLQQLPGQLPIEGNPK